jgi:heme-degrading monooxygenase HmoA
MDDMFVRIWEYTVPSTSGERFARAYGPSGDWAQLFRHGAGYAGTELCRSTGRPDHFVTVDRWNTETDWTTFLERHRSWYEVLDADLEGLATVERAVFEGGSWPST